MIIDKEHEFCLDQAITSSSVASTNVIDLGKDRGAGEEMHINLIVTEDFGEASGTPKLTISLESDNDEAFGSGDEITHWTTPEYEYDALTEGTELNLPPLPAFHGRYVRLYFGVGADDFNAGKLTGHLVHDKQTNKGNY